MQVLHYLRVFKRWGLLILLGTILSGLATFWITSMTPPEYKAIALVEVVGSSPTDDVYSKRAQAVAESFMVTSTEVIEKAGVELPHISQEQWQAAISASPKEDSQIIEIRAYSSDPQQAADMVNAVARAFVDVRTTILSGSLETFAEEVKGNVDSALANLQDARKQWTELQQAGAFEEELDEQFKQVDKYQESYNSLLATYRQAELQIYQAKNALRLAKEATLPLSPESPRGLTGVALAVSVTFVLLLALAVLLDWLDTRIRTAEDVPNLAALPALGSVPAGKHALYLTSISAYLDRVARAQKQAWLIIGGTLIRQLQQQTVLLVTAPNPKTGATNSTVNLAVFLAHMGKRVLVIEAHTQSPALHTFFQKQVQQIQEERSSWRTSLVEGGWQQQWGTAIENLWYVPSTDLVHNTESQSAIDVLSPVTANVRTILSHLGFSQEETSKKTTIDVVLIDAPALDEDGSTLELASLAQATILVLQAGRTNASSLLNYKDILQRLGAPVFGVIVNRQKRGHYPYFYQRQVFSNTASSLDSLADEEFSSTTPVIVPKRPLVRQYRGEDKETNERAPVLSERQSL